jgi:4-hydroxybenzoate polyprenyltransferase
MNAYLKLARPKQWTKNLLVFAGLIFSQNYFSPSHWFESIQMFVIFSLIASGIYAFNDFFDIENDRQHPVKKDRPLASGHLNASNAIIFAIFLIIIGLIWSWYMNQWTFILMVAYVVMMLAYSIKLKQVLLLDVFIIATGFSLRAVVGAAVIEVEISKWFIFCIFSIGLMLALIKRRQELARLDSNLDKSRLSLKNAPPLFVWDLWITMISAITIVSYTLYTFDPDTVAKIGSQKLMYTSPIVLFAMLRYHIGVFVHNRGEDPTEAILGDRWIWVAVIAWLGLVILIQQRVIV